jgi:hypothetical protein
MSEADRAALARGTLTSGIDLAQVAAAREALAAVREAMPEPAPQNAEAPIRVSTCILAGLLIGAVVWFVR